MILTALMLMAALPVQGDKAAAPQDDKPVTLSRTFVKGEKDEYEVKASFEREQRRLGLNTFIPFEEDINYKFSLDVVEMKGDGIAVVRYARPYFTHITGESATHGPITDKQKIDESLLLTISPINEVIAVKDETKKKPKPDGKPDDSDVHVRNLRQITGDLDNMVFGLNQGILQIVLSIGSLETGVDLAPKFPFDAVKVGDTWKKTGGFSPQKVKGESEKMSEQRLDFTYTYKGIVEDNGKKYMLVRAELNLDTDLGNYINQRQHTKPADSGLKSVPFKLKAQLDFYLDPATRRTVKAVADSLGEGRIMVTELTDPYEEMRMKGHTVLKLVSAKP